MFNSLTVLCFDYFYFKSGDNIKMDIFFFKLNQIQSFFHQNEIENI